VGTGNVGPPCQLDEGTDGWGEERRVLLGAKVRRFVSW
jgi:hypothetical protein